MIPIFVFLLALVIVALPPASKSTSASVRAPFDRIDHIIVIVEQNHTFDSYFGTYPGANGFQEAKKFPYLPGSEPLRIEPFPYRQGEVERFVPVPGSESLSNGRQTAIDAYNEGEMDGFALAQAKRGLSPELPMLYHEQDSAKALWEIADEFVLFDNYFSAVLGGSLPNMLHLIAGRAGDHEYSRKSELESLAREDLRTVFDELQVAGVSWKYYIANIENVDPGWLLRGDYMRPEVKTPSQLYWAPVTAMYRFWEDPGLNAGLVSQEQFFRDAAAGELPAVSFVLPSPTDHPVGRLEQAQERLLSLVNAVAKGPQWDRTAIFIVWDDWGGFYDHVSPPPELGFRVPALLISPWARQGYISHVEHDHTSILNFIVQRFGLDPLSDRQMTANGFEDAFQSDGTPKDPPAFSSASVPSAPVGTPAENRSTRAMYLATFGLVGAALVLLRPRRDVRQPRLVGRRGGRQQDWEWFLQ